MPRGVGPQRVQRGDAPKSPDMPVGARIAISANKLARFHWGVVSPPPTEVACMEDHISQVQLHIASSAFLTQILFPKRL